MIEEEQEFIMTCAVYYNGWHNKIVAKATY